MEKKLKNGNFVKSIPKLNKYQEEHPNEECLIRLENTKGITSDDISKLNSNIKVRVATGYDKVKVRIYDKDFGYYDKSVIYTKDELFEIIKRMEQIESGINPNWSEIQKAMYVDDKIKSRITYTLGGKENTSREKSDACRTLRGLLSNENVCAGYSMIFKELMDRQGIKCYYVEGGKTGHLHSHAWNLLKLKRGNLIYFDITNEAKEYRENILSDGSSSIYDFIYTHVPGKSEKITNYFKDVCDISYEARMRILASIENEKSFLIRTYNIKRENGENGVLTQIGCEEVEDKLLYKYVYSAMDNNGNYEAPKILYSHNNLAWFVEFGNRNKKGEEFRKFSYHLVNSYLTEEKINYAVQNTNGYMGLMDIINGEMQVYRKISGDLIEKLPVSINEIERADGTKLTISEDKNIEQDSSFEVLKLHKYIIYEMIDGFLKQNIVYSEMDFSRNNEITKDEGFINQFLSRDRLDRKVKNDSGYLGMYVPGKINGCTNVSFVQTLQGRRKKEIVDLKEEDFIKAEGKNFMEL